MMNGTSTFDLLKWPKHHLIRKHYRTIRLNPTRKMIRKEAKSNPFSCPAELTRRGVFWGRG